MSKENEEEFLEEDDELIDEEVFDDEDEDEDEDEEDPDKKGEKSKKSSKLKEKYKKLQGIAKRQRTKLKKQKENPESKKDEKGEKDKKDEKKVGLDKVDRYFLRGEGIKSEDEIKLVEQFMEDTGRSVEKVVESKVFQAELKELRDEKATKEATPGGSKRSGAHSQESVEYWIAKGGLPKDNPELARKVVAARMKQKRNENTFSDTPVID